MKLYISPKIIKQFSNEKGHCYVSKQRIESGETLMKIPLKECLNEVCDTRQILFTFPLIRKVVESNSFERFYPHSDYKSQSAMYKPIYHVLNECARYGINGDNTLLVFIVTLHTLYLLCSTPTECDKVQFDKYVHAYHIVTSRCVTGSSPSESVKVQPVYLVPYFDDLNNDINPNCVYKLDSKYLTVKSNRVIKPYTELTVMYGSDLTRDKIYIHYNYIDDSFPVSEPSTDLTSTQFGKHILEFLTKHSDKSVYDVFHTEFDNKELNFMLDGLLTTLIQPQ